MKKLITTIGILLSFCSTLIGQEYTFTHLSTSNGLGSNFVYAVWQDPKGFLWIGSEFGLQRFDGKKFVAFYRKPNFSGLPFLAVHQILDDRDGRMWLRLGNRIGTFNSTTMEFRQAKIQTLKPIPPRSSYQLWKDHKGTIYLLVSKYRLLTYNPQLHQFEEGPLPFQYPANWTINHLFDDPLTGNYWLCTDSGLVVYDAKLKGYFHHRKPSERYAILNNPETGNIFTHFFIDKQRRYWAVYWVVPPGKKTGQFLLNFDEKLNQFTRDSTGIFNSSRGYAEIHQVKQFSDTSIWAHGLDVLTTFNQAQKRFIGLREPYPTEYGIRYKTIYQIFQDKENSLWLATDNGLYTTNFTGNRAIHAYLDPGKTSANINAVLDIGENGVLVGTWGRGVVGLANPSTHETIYKGSPPDNDYKLTWDMEKLRKNGKLIITCQAGKLIFHDPASRKSTFLHHPIFNNRTIRQVVEDCNGQIWFSTQGGRLILWQQDKGTGDDAFTLIDEHNTIINKLYIDRKCQLWAGTLSKGAFVYDTRTGKMLRHYNSSLPGSKALSDNTVNDIIQVNDTIMAMAVGTLNLLNLKTSEVQNLTIADGLQANSVLTMQTDRFGHLWLTTMNGINKYNLKQKIFTSYDQRDGLITTTSQDNLLDVSTTMANGDIVLAGNQRAVIFNPDYFMSKAVPPNVSITDFKLFNEFLPPDSILKLDKVKLNYERNSITIEFASLSFLQRDKLIYYYMLEGADKSWQRTEDRLAATYTLLPPGRYTFKVKCENEEGTPCTGLTTLNILITPPFYKTWWFISIILMALSGLVLFIHQLRINKLLAVEKVRTRVARDLHDDMGSTLSTINILSEMAKMKIEKDPKATKEYIEKISDNSSRMMEAMDDIVWSINPMNDNIQRITARMREFAATVLEPKDIEYEFHVDDAVMDLTLDMESRRDLFLVFKEAVNNLAKYSDATHAAIRIFIKSGKLHMDIRDDGKGFDVATADSGNGLTNMRKRTEMMKGILRIMSGNGKGTEINLELPLT
ncbi:histidine kinase [Flavihumibacter rivuli]|uniref:sensor histidine kinase n=1 Tax=Flavihumibacter rivuli TaxID=2838156 RepID=UPI001BDF08FE|nr:sensor histidine kinase [Flavihumibacter rivuli]ULQ58008.1 histidine kinase [Flavihumibacter rivuli]